MFELEGELTAAVLPSLLRGLYVGRRTGRLVLRQAGDVERCVRFREGRIVGAASSCPSEHMGEGMVRAGRLSQLDLDRATELVTGHGMRLGQALVELGAVEAADLEDLLAEHARLVLEAVLRDPTGRYAFEKQDLLTTPLEDATLKLPTAEIILEAVRRIDDPDLVRAALGDLDRVLVPSADPLLRFQPMQLSPTDGFVLSRVDGTLSPREVLQMIPLPAEDVERSLLGLLCTGVIDPAPPPPGSQTPVAPPPAAVGAQRVSAQAARAAAPPAATVATLQATVPSTPEAADVAPPPAPRASEPPEPTERRREIEEMLAGLKDKTHFEVLGLPRASGEVQVKEAYFRMVKRFHPDATRQDPSLADLHDALESIFIRVGEAYEVLRDARRRAAYESDLASRAARTAAPPQASPPVTPAPSPEGDPADDAGQVDAAIAAAERLIRAERFWDAIQLLERAQPLASGKQDVRLRYVLAKAVGRNPHWVKRAEELLVSVVRDEPSHVGAHWLLVGIYRQSGLRARATSMLRRVVELQPDHEEALALLHELAPAPEPQPQEAPPASGGGLLKRLFGKGTSG